MGVTSKFADTGATNLWTLLNGNEQFLVPQFQRNYAWTKDTADTLWRDLIDGFQLVRNSRSESQEGQYLLGPIVLVHDTKNKYWVIDGQQRLSTITMLFCVARDIMLENISSTDNLRPEGYEKVMEMLENVNLAGKRTSWKLVLNDTDKDLFQEIQEYEAEAVSQVIRIKKPKQQKAKSQRLLRDNYVYLHEKMMDAIYTKFSDNSDIVTTNKSIPMEDKRKQVKKSLGLLNQFLNHVMKNNYVVKIVVEDNDTAYQIFETLNYRGQTLSKSNLIKNHVLSQIKNTDEQRSMSIMWNNVFDDIISQGEADDVFILESFRSRNPKKAKKASPRNLYNIVKKEIDTERKAKQYVKTLKADAEFLTTLYTPDRYQDKNTKDNVNSIKLLKAKNIRAPILTAYREWYDESKQDYNQLVKFLVKFFFNVRIIRETHAGKIEKKMLEIIKLIGEGASFQSVITELQEDYDHDDFIHNFNKFMTDPAPNVAKYVLQQITLSLGTRGSDVKPIDPLTLEHILPKNTSKWDPSKFFEDYPESGLRMDDFVTHLGNLTLLKDEINKKLQNEVFAVKKGEYKGTRTGYCASNLEINKQTVCNHNKWTAEIIEDRANLLATHAHEIWNLNHQ